MILPLGLSYLIFTVLSYQIEIRRKNISPETHMGYFSLYLLFFPKIAQGPIERPQNLIPMLRREAGFNYFDVTEGMKQMLWGYFKKLVVADRLAMYVNAIYSNVDHHNGTTLLLATVLFAFQIYADFSGYTDIALGSARLFGFKLTNNFRQPYLATSVKDFWDRWHISFSQWLRDYIFTPLAYALTTKLTKEKYFFISKEKWIYTIAIMITFAICGIWHGVGWTYLVWGLLFGFFLTYSNWMRDYHKKVRKRFHIRKGSVLFSVYKISVTFTLILAGWIVFRAESLTDAFSIMSKIFTLPGQIFYEKPSDLLFAFFGVLSLIAIDFKREYFNSRWSVLYNKYPVVRLTGIVLIVITLLLSGVFDGGQFIYFQF
jgi:D-alanyl-lipoteichoic acid acyltransferase DltB (MBOAT superfamily)